MNARSWVSVVVLALVTRALLGRKRFALWLVAYIGACIFFVPRLGKIGKAQADARSLMTGRVTDAYFDGTGCAISQASTAMIAQANQSQQNVMSLLR